MPDDVKPFSPDQLTPEMKAFFASRYALECEIDDIKQSEIAPLNEDLKTLKGDFKAKSGLDMKVTNAFYALYKLHRGADRLQEEEDARKRKDSLERAFAATAQGHTLDWMTVDAFTAKPAGPLFEERQPEAATAGDYAGEGETGYSDDEEQVERGPAELTFASADRDDADPAIEDTSKAWEAADGGVVDEEALDQGGRIYHEGVAAGRQGALAEDNHHDEGDAFDLWEKGRKVGFREFEAAQSGDDGVQTAQVVNLFDDAGTEDDSDIDPGLQPIGDLGAERPAFPAAL